MNAFAILVIGTIVLASVYWFLLLWKKDADDRMYRPFLTESLGRIGCTLTILIVPCWIVFYVFLLTQFQLHPLPDMMVDGIFGIKVGNQEFSDKLNSLSGWLACSTFKTIVSTFTFIMVAFIFYEGLAPKRLMIPMCFSCLLIAGGFFYNVFLFFDTHAFFFAHSIPAISALGSLKTQLSSEFIRLCTCIDNFDKCSTLAVALLAKSYFGPLTTGYVLGWEAYLLISYQEFEAVPILSILLDWVFKGLPSWVPIAYLVVQISYNIIMNDFEFYTDTNHHN
jgi:hypothetical protein